MILDNFVEIPSDFKLKDQFAWPEEYVSPDKKTIIANWGFERQVISHNSPRYGYFMEGGLIWFFFVLKKKPFGTKTLRFIVGKYDINASKKNN